MSGCLRRLGSRGIPGLALLLAARLAGAADAPAWLTAAAAMPSAPMLEKGAGAVVLLDETRVTASADGRVTTRRQYAVRVLSRDGVGAAAVREVYSTDGGDVRSMRGWLLVDGRVTELGRNETVDLALADNDVYNEARVRVLSAGSAAFPAVIFGAETEVVERTVFTQLDWPVQQEWPVRTVRRMLTLPSGSSARSVTLNAAPVEPVKDGLSYVWTLRDQPAVRLERWGPPPSALVPRIAVTYDLGVQADTAFESWESVARWLNELGRGQTAATPDLVAKARALSAEALSDLERVRAIGRFAQQVQYISIQTGLGRGGGYKPRAASDVLAKNYGDCKDKANLMKTMLGVVGIRAHLVTVYSGDPDYVRSEWPSPQQFNHAIVAVSLPSATDQPATLTHPTLGPLLFFDPTDEYTPVGELPRYLQGSQGLIVADGGTLARMPTSRPDSHARVRRIAGSLTPEGGLTATVQYATAGEPASIERRVFRSLSKDDYSQRLERDLRRQVANARLLASRVGDDIASNRFEVTSDLQALGFAQVVGRLLVVKPPELAYLELPDVGAGGRVLPVQLEFSELRDVFDVELPTRAVVDELPQASEVSTAFGSFSVRWQANGTRVVRSVQLRLTRMQVAAADAGAVRRFVDAFRDAERQPVVLAVP